MLDVEQIKFIKKELRRNKIHPIYPKNVADFVSENPKLVFEIMDKILVEELGLYKSNPKKYSRARYIDAQNIIIYLDQFLDIL